MRIGLELSAAPNREGLSSRRGLTELTKGVQP
jgi:hypothetical protein